MDSVPWAHWARPAKLVKSTTDNTSCGSHGTVNQQASCHGSSMPTAGRKTTKHRGFRGNLIKVVRLRVKLFGKTRDRFWFN